MTHAEITAARKQLGMTQAELARVMGLGAAIRVSEWERGVHPPSQQAQRLLRAYLDGYRPDDWPGSASEGG